MLSLMVSQKIYCATVVMFPDPYPLGLRGSWVILFFKWNILLR